MIKSVSYYNAYFDCWCVLALVY